MRVQVNGAAHELVEGVTLATLLPNRQGVAAAVNGVVVRAEDWPTTRLCEGDAVEVLTAHQGG